MKARLKKNGISVVALVITLVVLVILTGAVIIPSISAPNQARLAVFYNNVQTVQDLVAMQLVNNEVDTEHKNDSRYKWAGVIEGYDPEINNQPFMQQIEGVDTPVAPISRELLKNTSLQGTEKDKYYIDMDGIVYYEGFVLNGNTYYNKNSMVDEEVEPRPRPTTARVQGFAATMLGSTLAVQGIIKYEFSIDGGQTWTEERTFTNVSEQIVESDMLVRIVDNANNEIARGNVEVTIVEDETTKSDGTYSSLKEVNTPKLLDGMEPVYWNGITEVTMSSHDFSYEEWYDYVAQTGTTDGKTSKWANAKTADGNYWVWIPRYEYRITKGLHGDGLTYTGTGTSYRTTEGGTIDVKFVENLSTTPTTGYRIHPAFTVGNTELPGIWVAKYQVSMQDNQIKILPGQIVKKSISLANCFTSAYNYDRDKESHLTKNIEWGAMTYLTNSQYGRNGNEVTAYKPNSANNIYTASDNTVLTTQSGVYTSTGNVYGIYDINGGAWDYVAAGLTDYITPALGADKSMYYDCYDPLITYEDYGKYNHQIVYGDAIYEVTNGIGWWDNAARKDMGTIKTGWFSDFSLFCTLEENYLERGGSWDRSGGAEGIFSSTSSTGDARNDVGYRIVLWGELE